MKKIIITIIIVILVLAPIAFLAVTPLVNNYTAARVANELEELPLPENTEIIETTSFAGKFVGNGNGMQYFGAILIKSELPLESLTEHYSQYVEKEWECVVERQEGNEIQELDGSESFQTDVEGEDYYIVYSWGSSDSIFSELDLRGH